MCARGRRERGGGEGGEGRREGGASTASQEARGRVAMQMDSIHIANHWSLSALQRKSLFRQNSRIWSYVLQPLFLSQSTLSLQSFSIHSPVWTLFSGLKKEKKTRTWDRLDSFRFLLLSSHPSAFLPLLLLPFLCVSLPCSLSLSVNLGKFCDNSRLDLKKNKNGKKQSSLILASPLLKKTYCRRVMMLQLIYFKELSQTHTRTYEQP